MSVGKYLVLSLWVPLKCNCNWTVLVVFGMVQVVSIIYFTEISFVLKIRFHCFPAKNCAAIGCLVELCPNGQMPPVPPGDHEIITRPLIMDHYIITTSVCHHGQVILKLNVKNTMLDD